jgi:hypothetical protein
MEKRILAPQTVEIRARDDGKSVIEGYVVKWNQRSHVMMDWWGDKFVERVAKGAFSRSLSEKEDIKAFWNHNSDMVLGSTKAGTLQLSEDDVGLRYSIDPPETTWGRDCMESIRRGDVSGTSFGFFVRKDDWEYLAEEDIYQRTLLDIDLIEISPTPLPAYPDSEVQISERALSSESKEKLTTLKRHVKGGDDTERQKLELELEFMAMGVNL